MAEEFPAHPDMADPEQRLTFSGTMQFLGEGARSDGAFVAYGFLGGSATGLGVAIKYEGMRINPPHEGDDHSAIVGPRATDGTPVHAEANLAQGSTIAGGMAVGTALAVAIIKARHRIRQRRSAEA